MPQDELNVQLNQEIEILVDEAQVAAEAAKIERQFKKTKIKFNPKVELDDVLRRLNEAQKSGADPRLTKATIVPALDAQIRAFQRYISAVGGATDAQNLLLQSMQQLKAKLVPSSGPGIVQRGILAGMSGSDPDPGKAVHVRPGPLSKEDLARFHNIQKALYTTGSFAPQTVLADILSQLGYQTQKTVRTAKQNTEASRVQAKVGRILKSERARAVQQLVDYNAEIRDLQTQPGGRHTKTERNIVYKDKEGKHYEKKIATYSGSVEDQASGMNAAAIRDLQKKRAATLRYIQEELMPEEKYFAHSGTVHKGRYQKILDVKKRSEKRTPSEIHRQILDKTISEDSPITLRESLINQAKQEQAKIAQRKQQVRSEYEKISQNMRFGNKTISIFRMNDLDQENAALTKSSRAWQKRISDLRNYKITAAEVRQFSRGGFFGGQDEHGGRGRPREHGVFTPGSSAAITGAREGGRDHWRNRRAFLQEQMHSRRFQSFQVGSAISDFAVGMSVANNAVDGLKLGWRGMSNNLSALMLGLQNVKLAFFGVFGIAAIDALIGVSTWLLKADEAAKDFADSLDKAVTNIDRLIKARQSLQDIEKGELEANLELKRFLTPEKVEADKRILERFYKASPGFLNKTIETVMLQERSKEFEDERIKQGTIWNSVQKTLRGMTPNVKLTNSGQIKVLRTGGVESVEQVPTEQDKINYEKFKDVESTFKEIMTEPGSDLISTGKQVKQLLVKKYKGYEGLDEAELEIALKSYRQYQDATLAISDADMSARAKAQQEVIKQIEAGNKEYFENIYGKDFAKAPMPVRLEYESSRSTESLIAEYEKKADEYSELLRMIQSRDLPFRPLTDEQKNLVTSTFDLDKLPGGKETAESFIAGMQLPGFPRDVIVNKLEEAIEKLTELGKDTKGTPEAEKIYKALQDGMRDAMKEFIKNAATLPGFRS